MLVHQCLKLTLVLLLSFLATTAEAKRKLSATSLVTCMQNSQITPINFNVTFNPDDRSLRYTLDLTTEISAKVMAHVQVYAYGFLIIEKDVDMCSIGWKQFCPIYPGSLQVDSVEYISSEYTSQIPGIAYQVPDIDAVVKVIVKDQLTGEQLSCLQSNFSNGKTISQTGVKWATAVIAGLGLLIAAILSTFGNSNAASHIAANAVSLFLYFQSVVLVSMQAVERVPPIASAWSENLAWSMGLIRIKFMQDIFRWYVQLTGGTPTTYFLGVTQQIIVQKKKKRSLEYVYGLGKRALDYALSSNTNLIILRGIKRIGYNSHIEPTSIVATGFTWTVLIGYLLVVILVLLKSIVVLLTRANKLNPRRFTIFRGSFHNVVKGALLRYIYIASTQLVLFSLWEFTQVDSAAMVVLAVLFIILLLIVIGWSFVNVLKIGKQSKREYNNAAARLYGDNKVLEKWGFCYTMFHADKYWFGPVLMGYNIFKVIFIAFCQSGVGGKVSVLPVFIADLFYTIFLIWQAPYLNKPTNIINYMMSIVSTINSFLFLFFSDLFGQPAQVGSIMGWIFFILNAAFALILLIIIVVLMLFSMFSKNPDARFAPAKDDRFSFQRKSSVKRQNRVLSGIVGAKGNEKDEGELAALGIAAQDHTQDWESQMYKLNNLSNEEEAGSSLYTMPDHITPSRGNIHQDEIVESSSISSLNEKQRLEQDQFEQQQQQQQRQNNNNQSLGSKLKTAINRTLSKRSPQKSKTGQPPKEQYQQQLMQGQQHREPKQTTRVSDTLMNTSYDDDDHDIDSEKQELTPLSNPYLRQTQREYDLANSVDGIAHRRNQSNLSQINSSDPTKTNNVL